MKIYMEKALEEFEFWSGARYITDRLTSEEFREIEAWLDDGETEYSETDINDFFWFEDDTIAEILGFEDGEDLYENLSKRDRT